MYDTLAILIAETYTANSYGERIPVKSQREIWAEKRSIQRSEWAEAGQQGLNPSMMLLTPLFNYDGEKIAVVGGQTYAIYRTYERNGGEIELYLENQSGVK